jgi:hypothetical protein
LKQAVSKYGAPALAGFLFLLLTACATFSSSSASIDALHLFGLPVTLNFDGAPGSDGFAIRIYATQNGEPKGSPIRQGEIEIWMFDGVVENDRLLSTPPTQTWKFNPRELNQHVEQTSLGFGYKFALRWNKAPAHGHITVVARHSSSKSAPIYSSASVITAATN